MARWIFYFFLIKIHNDVLLMKNELLPALEQNHVREDFCSTVVFGGPRSRAANGSFAESCLPPPTFRPLWKPVNGHPRTARDPPAGQPRSLLPPYGAGPAPPARPSGCPGGRLTRAGRPRDTREAMKRRSEPPLPRRLPPGRCRRALLSRASEEGPSVTDVPTDHNGRAGPGRASLPLPLAPASQRPSAASERGGHQ